MYGSLVVLAAMLTKVSEDMLASVGRNFLSYTHNCISSLSDSGN
jgi:hypothetical protein